MAMSGMLAVLLTALLLGQAAATANLDRYHIDKNEVAVVGVSAGGYMAVQYHVAFSSLVKGSGIIAAGPYYCAQDNVELALTTCMTTPSLISVSELVTITRNTANTGFIDDPSNLSGDKVYLFSGTKDTVVDQGVVKKLQDYYSNFDADIVTKFDIAAEHSHVTANYGNACDNLGSPYINNCNYDSSKDILSHIYGDLASSVEMVSANLLEFDQTEFIKDFTPGEVSLAESGYVYVPTACQQGAECKLLMAFHGCNMQASKIGTVYVEHAGYNEWAEANNIVVLYPQAQTNVLNPQGCFDWWGYAGTNYASRSGEQVSTFKRMMDRITGAE